MPFGQADLPALFRDGGLLVVLGGSSTYGLVDRLGVPALRGVLPAIGGTLIRVTIETGTLTGLVAGAVLSIGAATLRVREIRAIGDGAVTVLLCERG